jgi:hypothetical protein
LGIIAGIGFETDATFGADVAVATTEIVLAAGALTDWVEAVLATAADDALATAALVFAATLDLIGAAFWLDQKR